MALLHSSPIQSPARRSAPHFSSPHRLPHLHCACEAEAAPNHGKCRCVLKLGGGSGTDGGHSWPVNVFVNLRGRPLQTTVILKSWSPSVLSPLSPPIAPIDHHSHFSHLLWRLHVYLYSLRIETAEHWPASYLQVSTLITEGYPAQPRSLTESYRETPLGQLEFSV